MACDLILVLDAQSPRDVAPVLRQLQGTVRWAKVGLEMFTACGPDCVREIADLGFNVFLDLKLHDIPNTVAGGIRAVLPLGVSIVNVHASGGQAMMRAAAEAAATAGASRPKVIGVTVLTSLDADDLAAAGVNSTPAEQVVRLASLAKTSGLDGVVCSAHEIEPLRKALGHNFMLIVPGIRPAGADVGDQKRVMTPREAMQRGATVLVIGRPITGATDPAAAARAIHDDLAAG
jgi:orotidine-5'-phosphate decarboxylase